MTFKSKTITSILFLILCLIHPQSNYSIQDPLLIQHLVSVYRNFAFGPFGIGSYLVLHNCSFWINLKMLTLHSPLKGFPLIWIQCLACRIQIKLYWSRGGVGKLTLRKIPEFCKGCLVETFFTWKSFERNF